MEKVSVEPGMKHIRIVLMATPPGTAGLAGCPLTAAVLAENFWAGRSRLSSTKNTTAQQPKDNLHCGT